MNQPGGVAVRELVYPRFYGFILGSHLPLIVFFYVLKKSLIVKYSNGNNC